MREREEEKEPNTHLLLPLQAKDGFAVRKVALTKAVFMALLKDQDKVWGSVLEPLPQQPYADGTVFVVHNVRRLCSVLMRAYALACTTDPAKLQADANEIACFLDRAIALAQVLIGAF